MNIMQEWAAVVCADLGIDAAFADSGTVLDLARDVAHGVARPAAPLTAYLVGVAVRRGLRPPEAAAGVCPRPAGRLPAYLVGVTVGRGLSLQQAAGRLCALAPRWQAPGEQGDPAH